jgi:hypothetical protein
VTQATPVRPTAPVPVAADRVTTPVPMEEEAVADVPPAAPLDRLPMVKKQTAAKAAPARRRSKEIAEVPAPYPQAEHFLPMPLHLNQSE